MKVKIIIATLLGVLMSSCLVKISNCKNFNIHSGGKFCMAESSIVLEHHRKEPYNLDRLFLLAAVLFRDEKQLNDMELSYRVNDIELHRVKVENLPNQHFNDLLDQKIEFSESINYLMDSLTNEEFYFLNTTFPKTAKHSDKPNIEIKSFVDFIVDCYHGEELNESDYFVII